MNDGEALYKTICEKPYDDTARLVYADWLQEQDSESLQAWYIRTSIALSHPPQDAEFKAMAQWKQDFERCKGIILKHGSKWVDSVCPNTKICRTQSGLQKAKCRRDCPMCTGTGSLFWWYGYDAEGHTISDPYRRVVSYHRGFPVEVVCNLDQVGRINKITCQTCQGRKYGTTPTGSWGQIQCSICNNTGLVDEFQPTEWAKQIVRQTPITRFKLQDKQPRAYQPKRHEWFKESNFLMSQVPTIHRIMWNRLENYKLGNPFNDQLYIKWYTSREQAVFALSTVLGDMVRESVYGGSKE